ncbi:MAG: LysM peptidoglycan-binding domain-containing protein [Chloroflexi bacterium]|nr:LysM peptidoglycan-binding domain-containing protein [Chloroflexota bacterium]
MRRFFRVGMFLAAAFSLFAGTNAQSGNLLQNPSFETPGNFNIILDSTEEGTIFGVPPSWDGWIATSPRVETWMNLVPDGYPHTGLFKFDGGRSLSISRGFATFTTAVFQRVSVAAGTNVKGSARGFMERGSTPPPGAQFRVGIDPTGGSNPLNPAVVWSPWVASPNSWVQATVEATSASGAVTLILYSTQTSPSNPNAIYWDDAILEVGGSGGAAASGTPGSANVLPTPAFAPFVQPQGTRPDGSIVHIVISGDTLDAIAVAYGTTRDALLELNPDINRNFLQLGQEVIVKPPGTVPVAVSGTPATAVVQVSGTLSVTRTSQTPAATARVTATVVAGETGAATLSGVLQTPTVLTLGTPTVDASATPEPTVTMTPSPEPSPTDLPPAPVTQVAQVPEPSPDVTALCVWMFADVNQNRIQEGDEVSLAGGNIEIRQGETVVREVTTIASDTPECFFDIAPGDYSASGIAPGGYGITTSAVLSLRVQQNVRTNVRFGAAEGVTSIIPPTEVAQVATVVVPVEQTQEMESESLLQMSGLLLVGLAGVVILGGIGLALFIRGR